MEENEMERWEAEVLQAQFQMEQGNFSEARGLLDYALGEARCHGEKDRRVAEVKMRIAALDMQTGDAKSALQQTDEAISILAESENPINLAYALMSRASIISTLENKEAALPDLEKSVQLFEDNKEKLEAADKLRFAKYLIVLAAQKSESKNDVEAFDLLNRALSLQEEVYGKESGALLFTIKLLHELLPVEKSAEKEALFERMKTIEDIESKKSDTDDPEKHSWQFTKLDVLDVLHIQEEEAYKKSRVYLGDSVWLVQRLSELYDRFGIRLGESKLGWSWQLLHAFTCCFHGCRYQLLIGTMTLCKGHRTDSSSYLRKAIEFATFAILMLKNQPSSTYKSEGEEKCPTCGKDMDKKKSSGDASRKEMAEIWLEAANSNSAFAKYRSNFDIMKALRLVAPYMPSLYKIYEDLSKLVHPSFFSVAGQSKYEDKTSELVHNFHYFENRDDEQQKLIAFTLFQIIKVHIEILEGFGKAVHEMNSGFDLQGWNAEIEDFKQKFVAEKMKWKPVLDPENKYGS